MKPYNMYLVRVGAMGHIGRFTPADAFHYDRGRRVIVRTQRGLEIGEVLAQVDSEAQVEGDGPLLRAMTVEDDLLEQRLLKNRHEAFETCAARLEELQLPVQLMDVEHLFDGQTLMFYFLGDPPTDLPHLLDDLAERYDSRAQLSQFADTLTNGCGPSCGTEEGAGCGTSCSTGCALSAMCSTGHHH